LVHLTFTIVIEIEIQDELAKRTEFLRSQRDKLLAMKKAEREKQLDEVEQKQMKTRPKSARAARLGYFIFKSTSWLLKTILYFSRS
jgi:hypothetical protein